jgi:hypothetical protein
LTSATLDVANPTFSITPGCRLHPKEKLSRLSNAESHFLRSYTSEIAAIQSANPATPITHIQGFAGIRRLGFARYPFTADV